METETNVLSGIGYYNTQKWVFRKSILIKNQKTDTEWIDNQFILIYYLEYFTQPIFSVIFFSNFYICYHSFLKQLHCFENESNKI